MFGAADNAIMRDMVKKTVLTKEQRREYDLREFKDDMRHAGSTMTDKELEDLFIHQETVVWPRSQRLTTAIKKHGFNRDTIFPLATEMGYHNGECSLDELLSEYRRRTAH